MLSPMPETFGARLRRQREQLDIALSTIADKTKIKKPLLEALERDDVSQWPAGIFRRAFIRAYAHEIGLDPDVVVREFQELYPDPADEVSLAELASAEPSRATGHLPTRFGDLVRSLIGKSNGSANAHVERAAHGTARSAAPETVESARREAARDTELLESDLLALADLCTEFGRVARASDLTPLLEKAFRVLDAAGMIVWKWDPRLERLRVAWAHGYSEAVLSHLPSVPRDAKNATAAAFRSGQISRVSGSDGFRSGLALPIVAPQECVGVLAIELPAGRDATARTASFAAILAAQLSIILDEQPRKQTMSGRIGAPVIAGDVAV
jgi:GAF domain-containing protein